MKGVTDKSIEGIITKAGSPIDSIESEFILDDKTFKIAFNYRRFKKSVKSLGLKYNLKHVVFESVDKELVSENIGFTKQSPEYPEGWIIFLHRRVFEKENKPLFANLPIMLRGRLQ